MDVQAGFDDRHKQVVRAPGVVVHRVALLTRTFLGVGRRSLLREVDHLGVQEAFGSSGRKYLIFFCGFFLGGMQ